MDTRLGFAYFATRGFVRYLVYFVVDWVLVFMCFWGDFFGRGVPLSAFSVGFSVVIGPSNIGVSSK